MSAMLALIALAGAPVAHLNSVYPVQAASLTESRRIMFDYAKCVVKRRHDHAAEAIVGNFSNEEINKRYPDLIIGNCLVSAVGGRGAQMGFPGDLYRYALADALVNADLAAIAESDFSNRAPLVHVEAYPRVQFDAALVKAKSERARALMQEAYDKQAAVSWLSRYGECIVRHDPANTKAWLLSAPSSPEESTYITALQPAFAACLDGGTTYSFNRVTMRGLVAINYYRLAMAKPMPTAGKTQ